MDAWISLLADPAAHQPMRAVDGGLRATDGSFYPRACGGFDLRLGAGLDENKALQADIYDAKLGSFSDFHHPHNLMLVHERKLLDALPLQAGARVLEIGGHRSGALPYLVSTRSVEGVGVDIARVWVDAQNRRAALENLPVHWVVGDAEHLPVASGSMDAVVSFDVFEHLSDLKQALREASRVLTPGGTLAAHMVVSDIRGSLDGLSRWWDPVDFARRQASAGHFHDQIPTRLQVKVWMEQAGLEVEDVHPFNVWLQAVHDHRVLPALGQLKRRLQPAPRAPQASGPSTVQDSMAPDSAASSRANRFTRLYAATVIPALRVATLPDRVGSLLGVGGSCSFIAKKPKT